MNKVSPEGNRGMVGGEEQTVDNKINMEYIMKMVFMQNEGIKIGEDIIKVLRKIKGTTYSLVFGSDFFAQNMEKGGQLGEGESHQKMEGRNQGKNKNTQNIKKLMMEKIKQELFNARENASKI
jgi:hypothetical protein